MSRRAPLIAGLVAIVLVVGWYVTMWKPASSRLSSAQAAKASAVVKQEGLEGRLASLVRLERDLPASEVELHQSEQALPTSVAIPTVIDQIDQIAVADHIAWTNESQSLGDASSSAGTTKSATSSSDAATGASDGGNATVVLSLVVAGSYTDMSTFITDLEQQPRLIVIDTLTYAPQSGQGVAATIGARAFYDATPLPEIPGTVSGR